MLLCRKRGGPRGEEGQVLPVLLTGVIAILAVTMLLLQVGRAGILRSRNQTAADAAALAAMEAIRDAWRDKLALGILPFYDGGRHADIARAAAADYARRNGGELTDFDFDGGFGQYVVTVRTRSTERQGGDIEAVDDNRAKASAYASLTAPDCDITPGLRDAPGSDDSVSVQLLYCDGQVAASWTGHSPGDLRDDVAPYWEEPSLEPQRPEITHVYPAVAFSGDLSHAAGAPITRDEVEARAMWWHDKGVPYSMSAYHPGPNGNPYRTDCSGFVSMAWGLQASLTTTTLQGVAQPISKERLKKGDILLNSEGAGAGSHVVLFLEWANGSHTAYWGIEQRGGDGTVRSKIPYGYFSEPTEYLPWRYTNIKETPGGGEQA